MTKVIKKKTMMMKKKLGSSLNFWKQEFIFFVLVASGMHSKVSYLKFSRDRF